MRLSRKLLQACIPLAPAWDVFLRARERTRGYASAGCPAYTAEAATQSANTFVIAACMAQDEEEPPDEDNIEEGKRTPSRGGPRLGRRKNGWWRAKGKRGTTGGGSIVIGWRSVRRLLRKTRPMQSCSRERHKR